MGRRLMLTMLALLDAALAWTTISQSRYGAQLSAIQAQMRGNVTGVSDPAQLLGFLWSSPVSRQSRGLGSGITWAWDPKLCTALKPLFREDFAFFEFVGCDEMKAAMHRAFASWSDNHALISFTDVTVCAAWFEPVISRSRIHVLIDHVLNPPYEQEECAKLGQMHNGCSLAEIWVTVLIDGSSDDATSSDGSNADEASSGEQHTLALVVVSEGQATDSTAAATAVPHAEYSDEFTYSNGAHSSRVVVETRRGTLSFSPKLCWYLDSTCANRTPCSLTPPALPPRDQI
jgi:hypothetical protein